MYAFFDQAKKSLDAVDERDQPALRERIDQARAVIKADGPLLALADWKTPTERNTE